MALYKRTKSQFFATFIKLENFIQIEDFPKKEIGTKGFFSFMELRS